MIIDENLTSFFWINTKKMKTYHSNVWVILVWDDKVYKIFNDDYFFNKEKLYYNIFKNEGIKIPNHDVYDKYRLIVMENVRKDFKRKNNLSEIWFEKISNLLASVHKIDISKYFPWNDGKYIITWDIHSSNFFEEILSDGSIQLWIFDFSSARIGFLEEDLSNLYIDIDLDDDIFWYFLENYGLNVDLHKLYYYSLLELGERIKNWMNIELEKKKKYYKYMHILKKKINWWL